VRYDWALQTAIVVIGRNEGDRLRISLSSAFAQCPRVVYVDSGSTDGSPSLARSLGAEVVKLDALSSYTAARGRNAGFAFANRHFDNLELVQFLDGDCELAHGWLQLAERALASDGGVAAVFGRRREVHPERSVFSKICDIEWDGPVGDVKAFGGDVLLRAAVFREAGGFDETLIAGEEPELSVRIRRRGWRITRLDAPMTMHDAQMTRFDQWWMRSLRTGHAYAEGAWMHGLSPERHWLRETISIACWGALLPLVCLGLAAVSPPAALVAMLCYPLYCVRIYRRSRRNLGPADARLYAVACVVAKFPQALGVIRLLCGRLLGRRSRLVEYKAT